MIARGIVLLIAAAVAFGALRLAYGQRPAYVHVRWAPTVDAAGRAQMERTYHLTRGELREGNTWGYYVTDVSGANLRDAGREPGRRRHAQHSPDRLPHLADGAARRLPWHASGVDRVDAGTPRARLPRARGPDDRRRRVQDVAYPAHAGGAGCFLT